MKKCINCKLKNADVYRWCVGCGLMLVQNNMKTEILNTILSPEEAEKFLTDLVSNGECFNPEADAQDIVFANCTPTVPERAILNLRMEEVFYFLPDPLAFIKSLLKSPGLPGNSI